MTLCPCNSWKTYDECCGPILAGEITAPTAEALMRSRYTAYAVKNVEYLRDTLTEDQREGFDMEGAMNWAESAEWLGLEILDTEDGGENSAEGFVDFIARYVQGGAKQAHRETARFRKEDGKWLYVDGDVRGEPQKRATPKIGRNDPCHCGSGKKFKKCCGK
ncbi:MAG: YchJ family protein [Desulfovibrionaceae bacterium]